MERFYIGGQSEFLASLIKRTKTAKLSDKDKKYFQQIYPENYGNELTKKARKTIGDLIEYFYNIKDDIVTATDLYDRGKIEESKEYLRTILYKVEDLLQKIEFLEQLSS